MKNGLEDTLYVGGWELFIVDKSGSANDEIHETLHVMDDQQRVALVEKCTLHPSLSTPHIVSRFQLGNHLGTGMVELDESANVISYEEYHPYGTVAWYAENSSITARRKRYRYTGKERDEWTGLQCHGARYYMPWLGRWESADPAGMADGPNRYQYVRGNPVSGRDPSGMGTDEVQSWAADPLGAAWNAFEAAAPDAASGLEKAADAVESWASSRPISFSGPALVAGVLEVPVGLIEDIEELSPTPESNFQKHALGAPLRGVIDAIDAYAGKRDVAYNGERGDGEGFHIHTADRAKLLGIGIALVGSVVGPEVAGEVLASRLEAGAVESALATSKEAQTILEMSPKGAIVSEDGVAIANPMEGVSELVSQKQLRHVGGTPQWTQRGEPGYFSSQQDAQAVLDAAHSGTVRFLGENMQGSRIVEYRGVIGFNNNPRAGFLNQPTNKFMIKGTSSPSVVPISPAWHP